MLEVMHRVLLCMLEAVEGKLCLLEILEVSGLMRYVLLYILDVLQIHRFRDWPIWEIPGQHIPKSTSRNPTSEPPSFRRASNAEDVIPTSGCAVCRYSVGMR